MCVRSGTVGRLCMIEGTFAGLFCMTEGTFAGLFFLVACISVVLQPFVCACVRVCVCACVRVCDHLRSVTLCLRTPMR